MRIGNESGAADLLVKSPGIPHPTDDGIAVTQFPHGVQTGQRQRRTHTAGAAILTHAYRTEVVLGSSLKTGKTNDLLLLDCHIASGRLGTQRHAAFLHPALAKLLPHKFQHLASVGG